MPRKGRTPGPHNPPASLLQRSLTTRNLSCTKPWSTRPIATNLLYWTPECSSPRTLLCQPQHRPFRHRQEENISTGPTSKGLTARPSLGVPLKVDRKYHPTLQNQGAAVAEHATEHATHGPQGINSALPSSSTSAHDVLQHSSLR